MTRKVFVSQCQKGVCQPGQVQGKDWKFACLYFGPYEVVGITPTNAEVHLLHHLTVPTVFVLLDCVRKCYLRG